MAITSYDELKDAVADWTNRSDLTTKAGDFVTLAEARLNDMLLLRDMETEETLTLTPDENFVALPTGYISPITLWLIVDGERVLLEQVLPQALPYYTDATQPQYWAIDGENIRFDCPSAEAYSAKFRFLKKSNLSGSNPTNYLLQRRPDLYLAGALVEAYRYMRNGDEMAKWEAKFLAAASSMMSAENRSRAVTLRTDIATRGRSNIFRGE
jgi:hypothetical protein